MVVTAAIFETRGGALITDFEPKALTTSETANEAETVKPTISLKAKSEAARDWRSLLTPWKHSIAINLHGRWVGGPILPHDFDDKEGEVQVTARGLRVAAAHRSVLPLAALTRDLILPNGDPDTTLDSTWTGLDLGTIAKRIGQQMCAWPGWTDIPITWPADRAGTHEKTYLAVDRKKVDDAWTDLSNLQNGPDIRLRLAADGPDRFRWYFETGTQEQPRLQGVDVFPWEVGRGSGIRVHTDPYRMGSLAWSQGGRTSDTTIIRKMYDPLLVDAGFPLLELESDVSSNASDVATHDAGNAETLRTAAKPWEFWSFDVRANEPPYPYEYGPGSLIDVIVTKDTPVRGGFIPPGTYRRRIAGLDGGLGNTLTITCGEVYDA